MGKTILNTLKGAAFGAIGAVCLFIAGFFVELLNVGWSYVKKKYKLNTTNFLFLCNC